jgi:hypothetical protein
LDDDRITVKPPNVGPGRGETPPKRTNITQETYFEQLEKNIPGISQKLNSFIEDLVTCNVAPEFGTSTMTLRWRSNEMGNWNLGSITTSGQVWMDYLGQQAKNAGLLELHKQYLGNLVKLVPGAEIKKTSNETAWNVALDGKIIQVNALLVDRVHEEGWLSAIAEFQAAIVKSSQGN